MWSHSCETGTQIGRSFVPNCVAFAPIFMGITQSSVESRYGNAPVNFLVRVHTIRRCAVGNTYGYIHESLVRDHKNIWGLLTYLLCGGDRDSYTWGSEQISST